MGFKAEERREHRRFRIENSVSISSHGIFQVTDISKGGFCFKCPPYTPMSDGWKTDILAKAISLEGLSARRIWISLTENSSHEFLPTIVGAKFGKLSKKQYSLLLRLLGILEKNGGFRH